MNEQPLPMPTPDREGSGPQERQLFLVEDDGSELDPVVRFDKKGPIESVFGPPKSFEELTDELFQQQDATQPDSVLTREQVAEELRRVLEEREAAGDHRPISVEIASLTVRAKSEATSRAAETQRNFEHKYAAWRGRLAPTLPTLDSDGSVAAPATLKKAAGLFAILFVFLLLLTTWNRALVVAWIVVALYLTPPLWLPKVVTAWAGVKAAAVWVKKYLEPADKSPRE